MFNPFVKIGSQVKGNPANTAFLIQLPDLFFYICERVICNFQEFRMLAEFLHVFGGYFLTVPKPLLSIVCRVFEPLVIV